MVPHSIEVLASQIHVPGGAGATRYRYQIWYLAVPSQKTQVSDLNPGARHGTSQNRGISLTKYRYQVTWQQPSYQVWYLPENLGIRYKPRYQTWYLTV